MNRRLRIAVAEDEAFMREYLQETLSLLGHEVVAVAETGRELVRKCAESHPDLVITDIKMPDMDGLDAAAEIYANVLVPVIVISAYHDLDLIERAEQNHIVAYLVKPIKQDDLEPAIAIATRRFEEFQALRREADDLRHALEDRKTIERAKGILMRRTGLDEPGAFRRLQRLASEKSRKLVEIAEMIVLADEALQEPEAK
jgi:AmiR/NasT family two-component response regulator